MFCLFIYRQNILCAHTDTPNSKSIFTETLFSFIPIFCPQQESWVFFDVTQNVLGITTPKLLSV